MTEQSNNTEQSEYKPKWYDLEGINQKNVGSFLGFLSIIITLDVALFAGNIFSGIFPNLKPFVYSSTIISIVSTTVLYLQLTHYQGYGRYPKLTAITFALSIAPAIFILETFFILQLFKAINNCWIAISIFVPLLLTLLIYTFIHKNKEQ